MCNLNTPRGVVLSPPSEATAKIGMAKNEKEADWTTFAAQVEGNRLISIEIREMLEGEVLSRYVGLGAEDKIVKELIEETELIKSHLGEERALQHLQLYMAAMEVCHRVIVED